MAVLELAGVLASLLLLYVLWYLLCTDSDTVLAVAERFGRPVASFRGRVVWITGASSGLGEAMAHELAAVGAKLVLSARTRHRLEQVKEDCLELSAGLLDKKDILVLSFDISDITSHRTNVENAINHFGKVDVFVNNAAQYQIGSIKQTQPDISKELFDTNFFGGISLSRLLLDHFLEMGRGQFVVVSSIAGKMGVPSVASYSATKHALQGFYETLRLEHSKDNIAVTIVYPGIFQSSIMERVIGSSKGEELAKELPHYECVNMSSARCAHLTLVSAANKLFESWIAYQPFLLMLFGAQYFPDLYRYTMSKIYTKKRVQQLLAGSWPSDLPVWRPLLR